MIFPIFCFIFGTAFYLSLLICCLIRFRYLGYRGEKGIYVLLAFFGGFFLSLGAWQKEISWFGNFFQSCSDSISMFALTFRNDYFEILSENIGNPSFYRIYSSVAYIASFCSFAVISLTVVALFMRTLRAKVHNGVHTWIGVIRTSVLRLFGKKQEFAKRYIIFTDQNENQLRDLLDRLKRSSVTVVLNVTDVHTQEGAERKNLFLQRNVDVASGHATEKMLYHYAKTPFVQTVFYSIYFKEIDNLRLADMFLNVYSRMPSSRAVRRSKVYVSYQNAETRDKFNYYNDSEGRIVLFNEYASVAERFVFENPLGRQIPCDPERLEKEILSEENWNTSVHMLGFGRINRNILDHLIPVYQSPSSDRPLEIVAIDRKESLMEEAEKYRRKFESSSEIFRGDSFYPQCEYFSLDACRYDLLSRGEIFRYIQEQILPRLQRGLNLALIIACGDSLTNAQIAFKIRDGLKKISFENHLALSGDFIKRLILYVYVKENDFLHPTDFHLNEMKMTETKDAEYWRCYESDRRYLFENGFHSEESFRAEEYRAEEIPIFVFGREGDLPQSEDELAVFSKRHSLLYRTIDNEEQFETAVRKAEKDYRVSYRDIRSDLSAVLGLRMQLELAGYRMVKGGKTSQSIFDEIAHLIKNHPLLAENIRRIEHNRWSCFISSRGDLPLRKEDFPHLDEHGQIVSRTGGLSVKSPKKDVHMFLMSNESLNEVYQKMMRMLEKADLKKEESEKCRKQLEKSFFLNDLIGWENLKYYLNGSGYGIIKKNR